MEKYLVEFKEMIKRWNDFSGKSNLKEYWMPVLINIIISAIVQILVQIAPFFNYILSLYGLVLLIPFLALTVRRLNDVGKSWKYLLWVFLPIVGLIMIIIQLAKPNQTA